MASAFYRCDDKVIIAINDLEHDQVDQVDNGDNKTHKKETLKWEEGSHNIDVQSAFHDP